VKPTKYRALEAATLSTEKKGGTWEVAILAFGRSTRPPHIVYTREAAQRSIAAFEGTKVYALRTTDDAGHMKNPNSKSVRDIVGTITNVRVTESALVGDLDIFPSASWLKDNLSHAQEKNLPPPYELSIDASGKGYRGMYEGKSSPIAESFDRATVDVVERGAAGGKFLRMVASENNTQKGIDMKQKLLALFALLYPRFLEAKQVDLAAIDENELFTHLLEADKPQSRLHLPDGMELDEKVIDEKLTKIRESLSGSGDGTLEKMMGLIDKALAIPAGKPNAKDSKIELDMTADRGPAGIQSTEPALHEAHREQAQPGIAESRA
jgi:hypothetical protein